MGAGEDRLGIMVGVRERLFVDRDAGVAVDGVCAWCEVVLLGAGVVGVRRSAELPMDLRAAVDGVTCSLAVVVDRTSRFADVSRCFAAELAVVVLGVVGVRNRDDAFDNGKLSRRAGEGAPFDPRGLWIFALLLAVSVVRASRRGLTGFVALTARPLSFGTSAVPPNAPRRQSGARNTTHTAAHTDTYRIR